MKSEDEREAFWTAVHTVDDRVTDLKARFEERDSMTLEMIQQAVRQAMPSAMLTEQEHAWVKLAIQREAQMIAFRRAVIEKTFIGLVWAGIAALAVIVREYAIAHGMWKA